MHNSNQRSIFIDLNLIFGTLATNSLKDLKFVWEKRTGKELGTFTTEFFDLGLRTCPQTRKSGLAIIATHLLRLLRLTKVLPRASADASPAPTTRAQSKKADAANKTPSPAAAVDTAGTVSDDLELRNVGRAWAGLSTSIWICYGHPTLN